MTKLPERGYAVPVPAAPYELECFRVYVPKHSLYIGAFWYAYEFFTTWLAWMRDPFHRGKQAAAIWRTAYDKARALYEITKGTCEMNVTGVRQHPNDKCVLQVEFDGNNVWVDVANFKDCNGCGGGGAMQFDGTNVSIYNDCTGEFEPSGTPYNPTVSHIYDSLYDPGESGKCNGAANIAAWSKYVADSTLSTLSTIGIAGAAASFILGTLASSAGSMFLLDSLIAALLLSLEESGELLGDAAALDISEELRDILYGFMDDDGTIREPNFTEAVAALYARRDEEAVDTAERVRWGHEANIISALGPSVISRQNKYAGITDADCSGANWTHVFDFTTGKHGWIEAEVGTAVYVTGQGWRSILREDGFDNLYRVVQIKAALPERTITSVKEYYTAILGDDSLDGGTDRTVTKWGKNTTGSGDTVLEEDTEAGEQSLIWSGTQSGTSLIVATGIVGFNGSTIGTDPGGELTFTKIIISGTGVDPF